MSQKYESTVVEVREPNSIWSDKFEADVVDSQGNKATGGGRTKAEAVSRAIKELPDKPKA